VRRARYGMARGFVKSFSKQCRATVKNGLLRVLKLLTPD